MTFAIISLVTFFMLFIPVAFVPRIVRRAAAVVRLLPNLRFRLRDSIHFDRLFSTACFHNGDAVQPFIRNRVLLQFASIVYSVVDRVTTDHMRIVITRMSHTIFVCDRIRAEFNRKHLQVLM